MGGEPTTTITAPAWAATAKSGTAFLRGISVAATTPGVVLFLTALGFGTLVRDAGMQLGHALFLSAIMYALPAQVMVVDQLQRGAALLAIALAVTLTAVRLLPMTVSLLPYLQARRSSLAVQLLAVHTIAITAWVEGNRRLPHLPDAIRMPYFLGLGLGMMLATSTGGTVGYLMAVRMPLPLQTALLFMTPVYFLLSTFVGANHRRDWLAIGLGGLMTPLIHFVAPDVDLLLGGLIGGTLAYLAGRRLA